MKEVILLTIAGIFAVIYNIMVLGAYSLHENSEFKSICLFFFTLNARKEAILFGIILSNVFLRELEGEDKMEEQVNHPSHYIQGIEPIEVIESWYLNFSLGNAIKYILRSPYKGNQIEDLEKARWYIERERNRVKNEMVRKNIEECAHKAKFMKNPESKGDE